METALVMETPVAPRAIPGAHDRFGELGVAPFVRSDRDASTGSLRAAG